MLREVVSLAFDFIDNASPDRQILADFCARGKPCSAGAGGCYPSTCLLPAQSGQPLPHAGNTGRSIFDPGKWLLQSRLLPCRNHGAIGLSFAASPRAARYKRCRTRYRNVA